MIETVLFDLDGTIIDTNELIIRSFISVLEQNDLPRLSREEIIPHMGLTLEKQLQAFSGIQEVSHLIQSYRGINDLYHDEMVRPFEHVLEVIEGLHQRGIQMGIVTTKNRPGTTRVLEMFDIPKYMSTIVTLNDIEHPKPHPEPVLKAVAELQANPERTLMVGDSPMDIQSAQAAGVKSAGVAWSLKGEETLRQYHPDYMLQDMFDLYRLVEQE